MSTAEPQTMELNPRTDIPPGERFYLVNGNSFTVGSRSGQVFRLEPGDVGYDEFAHGGSDPESNGSHTASGCTDDPDNETHYGPLYLRQRVRYTAERHGAVSVTRQLVADTRRALFSFLALARANEQR